MVPGGFNRGLIIYFSGTVFDSVETQLAHTLRLKDDGVQS